jgi:hypothetical protein
MTRAMNVHGEGNGMLPCYIYVLGQGIFDWMPYDPEQKFPSDDRGIGGAMAFVPKNFYVRAMGV